MAAKENALAAAVQDAQRDLDMTGNDKDQGPEAPEDAARDQGALNGVAVPAVEIVNLNVL